MRHDLRPLLRDIDLAAADIETFVLGLTEGEYESSPLVKAAVERKFTVMGEALVRIRQAFPEVIQQIAEARDIIGFRNVVIHGYDSINDSSVWGSIHNDLPHLRRTVQRMLAELSKPG